MTFIVTFISMVYYAISYRKRRKNPYRYLLEDDLRQTNSHLTWKDTNITYKENWEKGNTAVTAAHQDGSRYSSNSKDYFRLTPSPPNSFRDFDPIRV